jgi:hypothetical protein
MHCAQPDEPSFLAAATAARQRDCSDETAHAIDEEVRSLLQELYAEAKRILTAHRDELDRVTRALLEQETLDEGTFQLLVVVDHRKVAYAVHSHQLAGDSQLVVVIECLHVAAHQVAYTQVCRHRLSTPFFSTGDDTIPPNRIVSDQMA